MAFRPTSPPRASAEDGFGIIEVLVSALIVISISLGLFAAIDAAGRTADTNKARSAASNLATSDQERLRGVSITDLPGKDEVRTVSMDNKTYTIRSQGEFVVGSGAGSSSCSSSENAPRHLKITSTVTWNKMTVDPVKQDSLRAIPNRSISGLGSMAVDIKDRNGAGLPNIPVTATGPRTLTGTTNAQGCVIFGFVPAGNYNVSFSEPGYVQAEYPNAQAATKDVVVAADAIATAAFQYDLAGAPSVKYMVNPSFGSTAALVPTDGTGFTIANSLMGSANSRGFTTPSGTTGDGTMVNFPFTTGYQVWSGRCAANKPTDGAGADIAAGIGAVTVPPGGTTAAADRGVAREFRLRIRVRRRNSTSTTSTTNYSTVPKLTGAVPPGTTSLPYPRVVVTPVDSACTEQVDATYVSSSGSGSTATSLWDAIVPWGSYRVCASYWTGTANSARAAITHPQSVSTTVVNGTTVPSTTSWVTIPHPATTNPVPVRTCPA